MKKKILGTLALLTLATTAVAAEPPKQVHASLELLKNDQQVSKVDLIMLEGQTTPYANVTTHTYTASIESGGPDGPILTPGTLTTGLIADVTATDVTAEGLSLAINYSYTELDRMDKVELEGRPMDLPSWRGMKNSVTLRIKPGQTTELKSISGKDKYVLVIRGA
jgi:hypothetical protein